MQRNLLKNRCISCQNKHIFFIRDTAILKNKVSVRLEILSDAAEDSSLLGCDTMSLGEWCPGRSCAPSYSVSSSARRIRLTMHHSM